MEHTRCEKHEKEIAQIKSDYSSFKKDVYIKIDELIDEVRKPIFTDMQWATITVAAIVYVVGIVLFVGDTNAQARHNKEDIVKIEDKQDKIIEILLEIKEDIGETKTN